VQCNLMGKTDTRGEIDAIQGWIQQGFSRGVLGEQPSVSIIL
jgi:hypothetical protein